MGKRSLSSVPYFSRQYIIVFNFPQKTQIIPHCAPTMSLSFEPRFIQAVPPFPCSHTINSPSQLTHFFNPAPTV